MPSEYVQRQFHVSFQDDPVAVACRHITGVSSIVWGNDYPHAEGTFRGSRELIERYYRSDAGEKIADRAALAEILGVSAGTLRIRAHRIRRMLEACVNEGMRGRRAR